MNLRDLTSGLHTIGAISMALIFFALFPLPVFSSLPFTETVYTIPEGEMELSAAVDFVDAGELYRRERMGMGFGVFPRLSIWYVLDYLHRGDDGGESELGDSLFRIWFYIGDFLEDSLHAGWSLTFRLPTGPSAYEGPEWRPVAMGFDEIRTGPVIQADFPPVFVHFNLFYVLRAAEDEGFYSGFSLNPFGKKTYTTALGLNPFSEGAFLYSKRLTNDYMACSIALNTDVAYPVMPAAGMYAVSRVHRRSNDNDRIPVEGAGFTPIFLHASVRYFFSRDVCAGLYAAVCVMRSDNAVKQEGGFNFSLQF
jgi:hypothetical protein